VRYVIDDSPTGSLAPVKRTFQCALDNPAILEHNIPDALSYLEQFRSNTSQPNYAIVNREIFMKKASLTGFAKQTVKDLGRVIYSRLRRPSVPLRSATAWPRFKYNFAVTSKARKLRNNGPFCEPDGLPDNSFAYFPLHFEPEASTTVVTPMHTNQVAIVESLAKSIPLNMDLVVKEHVTMLGLRPNRFYEQLNRIPGVILVSPFEDSISLIKRASLICVITGTAAWEALLLRRPVLIIGGSHFLEIESGLSTRAGQAQ